MQLSWKKNQMPRSHHSKPSLNALRVQKFRAKRKAEGRCSECGRKKLQAMQERRACPKASRKEEV